ncbi:MAG TPA: hypothetical protein VJK52_03855 [Candidatus Nanoarchaeia archaeon]|nr:hypothetical protein [Candidatus Nanoarchaeia archaeon]
MLRKAVRKGVRAGMRVAAISAQEGIRIVRPFVRAGKLSRKEAQRTAAKLRQAMDRQRRRADALIQREVVAELKRMGFVHRSQLRKRKR